MSDCVNCGGKVRSIKAKEAINAARGMVSTLRPIEQSPGWLIEERATKCRDCPSKMRKHGVDWCGKPFKVTDQTCGCLVWAKIRVIKEECPQGKW